MGVELYRVTGGTRQLVSSGVTNADGRTAEPLLSEPVLPDGIFELVFHAGPYFHSLGVPLDGSAVPGPGGDSFRRRGQGRELSRAAAAFALRLQHLPGFVMTGAQIIERCRILAGMSETPDSITRTYLCPAMRDVHRTLRTWMEEAGMTVTLDAAGNLRGSSCGTSRDAPLLLIGSHVDTVPDAGAYDGVLGVVLAIALVRALGKRRLRVAIEVVAFSEEEGVRFGLPFIGSRALVGSLNDDLLVRRDARGVSVAQAIRDFGLDPARLPAAAIRRRLLGYLEFHIEQGPVLDTLNLPLGVVTAIVGQSRCEVTFRGEANHAGTTPMHLRRDALAAAARWTGFVERTARSTAGVVATVGALHVHPGAANVVPGEVQATLDVRHADDAVRHSVTTLLRAAAEKIGARRNVAVAWRQQLDQPAVACDARLTALLARAVERSSSPGPPDDQWRGPRRNDSRPRSPRSRCCSCALPAASAIIPPNPYAPPMWRPPSPPAWCFSKNWSAPMFDLVIRGGSVVTGTSVEPLDIAVEDGRIRELGPQLAGGREELDARGLTVFPGLIDVHLHFNEPGRVEWEGGGDRQPGPGGGRRHAVLRHAAELLALHGGCRGLRRQTRGPRTILRHGLRTVGRDYSGESRSTGGARRTRRGRLQGFPV